MAESPQFGLILNETGQFTMDAIQTLWLGFGQEQTDRAAGDRAAKDRLEPKVIVMTATATDFDLKGSSIVHVTSGTFNLSGFIAPSPGKARIVVVYNSGAGTVTIKHQATSAAANQLFLLTGADTNLLSNKGTIFVYLSSKWRQVI